MSRNLKLLVIAFLQNLPTEPHEQFNQAFDYYRKSDNKVKSAEAHYNRLGYSERLLENLFYDLKRAYGITDVEILTSVTVNEFDVVSEEVNGKIVQMQANTDPTDNKDNFLDELSSKANEIITKESGDVDGLLPIREEFSFLNDADCPDVMFTVVGKRIRAYKKYQELHEQLQKANSDEFGYTEEQKLQITTDCEAAYNDNQALWNELNHYNLNKTILGEHEIFRQSNIQKEVEFLTNDEMYKFKTSSVKFFHDQKKALLKNVGNVEKQTEINKKIADREYKIALINARLGIDDKK